MPAGNVIYEVHAVVRADLCDAWEEYMHSQHVAEVVAAGGFTGATLERGIAGQYRIRYVAPDRERLERYRNDAAPALRADALARFPDGVDLAREVWEVVADW